MPENNRPSTESLKQLPAKSLDGRGAGAAWLILKVTSALNTLEPGQVLEVLGSDPKLLSDLPPVLARHGCRLLETVFAQGGYRFLLTPQSSPHAEGRRPTDLLAPTPANP